MDEYLADRVADFATTLHMHLGIETPALGQLRDALYYWESQDEYDPELLRVLVFSINQVLTQHLPIQ